MAAGVNTGRLPPALGAAARLPVQALVQYTRAEPVCLPQRPAGARDSFELAGARGARLFPVRLSLLLLLGESRRRLMLCWSVLCFITAPPQRAQLLLARGVSRFFFFLLRLEALKLRLKNHATQQQSKKDRCYSTRQVASCRMCRL